MATWTKQSVVSASFSNENTGGEVSGGEPVGLLLALTYPQYRVLTNWSRGGSTSASWTKQTVN